MATATFYPDAADGHIQKQGAVWATQRAAATGDSRYKTSTTATATQVQEDTGTYSIDRGFLTFDTSSLPDDALILSATLYVKPSGTTYSGLNDSACLVESTQASATDLATTDFGAVGTTELSASRIDISSVSFPYPYQSFPLNTAGLALVNRTGYTKFALRSYKDLTNSAPSAGTWSLLFIHTSEATGTSSDPYLEVTYSTARTTADTWAWSDTAERSTIGRAAPGTWAWSDSAAPYWRAARESVVVQPAGDYTTLDGSHTFPQATTTVASTAGWPSSGTFVVATSAWVQTEVTYTSKDATHFYGCTGGTGTFSSFDKVMARDSESHFPTVTPLDETINPAFLVSYQQKPGHGGTIGACIKGRISTDGGSSWGSEITLLAATVNSGYGIGGHMLARLKNGRLLMMWYEGNNDNITIKSYLSYSDNNGTSWSSPSQLAVPSGYASTYVAVGFEKYLDTGAGANATYGDLYVGAYGVATTPADGTNHFSKLMKVTDGGASGSWTFVSTIATIAQTGGYANGEPSLAVMPDGTWLSLLRVETPTLTRYQCYSTDAGATWTGHAEVVPLNNSASLIRRQSGLYLTQGGGGSTGIQTYFTADPLGSWPVDQYRDEPNGGFVGFNGSSFMPVTPVGQYDTVNAYAMEASNQAAAQVWFQWYEIEGVRVSTDSWAWSDSAAITNRTYGKATSDSWAWSDSAVGATAAYSSRTTTDTWAWTDTATKTTTYSRTTTDTWAWTDTGALPSASYYSRTTTDTWAWTDSSGSLPVTIYWLRARRSSSMNPPTKTYAVVQAKGTTKTATWTSPTYKAETEAGILVVLDVTAASGTGGLTLRINAHDLAGSVAVPLNSAPTAVTGTGTTSYVLYPFGAVAGSVTQATSFYLPRQFSITVTHGDSSSYTYSVGYCLLP